jgi:V-type H+-transporting ATPase subunit H
MSLDPPAYISSLQNNIRARPISWEGAVRAKTITEEDLKKIKAIDKVRKEQRKQTIEGDVETYTQLLLGGDNVKSIFESAAKRTDILQYMLVLAGDLVDGAQLQVFQHYEHTTDTFQTFPSSHSRLSSTPNRSSLSSLC